MRLTGDINYVGRINVFSVKIRRPMLESLIISQEQALTIAKKFIHDAYDTLILMNPKDLAPFLDLANHHANATFADIKDICDKVKKYGFNAAFVNPCYVSFARQKMGPGGKVGTVVSFPLGQDELEIKIAAAKSAALNGADELDVSLNVGLIKAGQWDESLEEMQRIVREVKTVNQKKIVKFILETGYLTNDEIKKAAVLVLKSGADFVKTNSGMGPRGGIFKTLKPH